MNAINWLTTAINSEIRRWIEKSHVFPLHGISWKGDLVEPVEGEPVEGEPVEAEGYPMEGDLLNA